MPSCKSQAQHNTFSIHYKAQTRGFLNEIQFKNDTLTKINSTKTLKIKINKNQINKLTEILNAIDFSKIKNNTNTEDLAVDKAIAANFTIIINNNTHTYQFIHKHVPEKIQQLLNYLNSLE
jgi:hypothetical protein